MMESCIPKTLEPPMVSHAEIRDLLVDSRPWLYRLALAITGRPHSAEDATQNALLRAQRSLGKLAKADDPRAWLRRVLIRCALDAIKTARHPEVSSGRAQHDQTESIAVRQTLDRLENDERVILALAFFEGLSYEEIGAALSIPSGTVGSRLNRAKENFRREWDK